MAYQAIGQDSSASPVTLTRLLSSGGEGYAYATDRPGYVAKVYKKGHATENKFRKCRWFVDKQISYEGICLPTHILADDKDNFVGYLMPEALGETLASIIHPLELQERYPDITRVHLAQLCIAILEQLRFLHENGLLVFDLDMTNILVDGFGTDKLRVFLVDCDSFQIGTGATMLYPGDVGRPLATPRELQKVPYEKQSRTFSNEHFPITVLLFKILVPNQSPYMRKGGENDEAKLVAAGDFPYTAEPSKIKGVASTIPGEWSVRIWSFLPEYMTRLFWDNLHHDGAHYAPDDRTNVRDWLAAMQRYEAELSRLIKTSDKLSVLPEDTDEVRKPPQQPPKQPPKEPAEQPIGQPAGEPPKQPPAPKAELSPAEQAKVFSEVSRTIHAKKVILALLAVFIVLFSGVLVSDPFSLISAESIHIPSAFTPAMVYENYPEVFADIAGYAILVVCALLFFGVTASLMAGGVWALEDKQISRYWRLSERAGKGELSRAKSPRLYKLSTLGAKQITSRVHLSCGALGLLILLVFGVLGYVLTGCSSTDLSWTCYAQSAEADSGITGEQAIINSATDGAYGDEADFVQAALGRYYEDKGDKLSYSYDWQGDTLEVEPYEPYVVRILVRNDNADNLVKATNVRLFQEDEWDYEANTRTVTYTVKYDDGSGTEKSVSDSVKVHFTGDFNRSRYGTRVCSRNRLLQENTTGAIDYAEMCSSTGALIGLNGSGGDSIPGGEAGYLLVYEDQYPVQDDSFLFEDGWSDYTLSDEAQPSISGDQALLDSITNPAYGDETDFVQAMAVDYSNQRNPLLSGDAAWTGDTLSINKDDPYTVRVLLRNDNGDESVKAENVRVTMDRKWLDGKSEKLSFTVSYDDATGNRQTMEDSVIISYPDGDTGSRGWNVVLRSKALGQNDAYADAKPFGLGEPLLVGKDGFDGVIPGGADGYCLLYLYDRPIKK